MSTPKSNKIRSDQVEKLSQILKDKRVSVYIDAANLYYASSKAGLRISFETILTWFQNHAKSVTAVFYTAYNPEGKEQLEFLQNLENIGYTIVKKPIKVFETLTKGNMDIELAVDAVSKKSDFDVLVLMSGDGDFSYLIQHLKNEGKKTVVVGIGGYTSFELHEVADHYFFLDRLGRVWQNKLKFNLQNYKIFLDTLTEQDYTEQPIELGGAKKEAPKQKLEKLKLRISKKR